MSMPLTPNHGIGVVLGQFQGLQQVYQSFLHAGRVKGQLLQATAEQMVLGRRGQGHNRRGNWQIMDENGMAMIIIGEITPNPRPRTTA